MHSIDDAGFQAEVPRARCEFLERQFGPLPARIHQLVNLSGVWPGGGIYEMAAPRLAGLGVHVTHGLTNPDMPATRRPGRDDPSLTEPREPRIMAKGLAGYGYELIMLTPAPAPWPMLAMSWFVQMEILNDLCLLERVAAGNGATVEGVRFGDGNQVGDFLIQQACSPILARVDLPNGLMHLLIATWITPDELVFARDTEDGCFELLNRLAAEGLGPVSRLDRRSVLSQ